MQHFGGRYGQWLNAAAHGRDERPVVRLSEPKSISRETTFDRDLDPRDDRAALSQILIALCDSVSRDLIRKGYRGKTVGIKLRYQDFRTITRDQTLASPIDDPATILRTARECLKRVPLDRKLRLLGIRAASLRRGHSLDESGVSEAAGTAGCAAGESRPLFDEAGDAG